MQKKATVGEALRLKYPEQVVIAIARDAGGKDNPITLGWSMIASGEPPMMAISVGLTRYSLGVIRAAGEFVIAFPSEFQREEALLFGTRSGRDCDKLAEARAATQPADKVKTILLAGAVANFECRLVGEIAAGDHVVFIGQVLAAHRNQQPLRRLYTIGPGYKMSGLDRG